MKRNKICLPSTTAKTVRLLALIGLLCILASCQENKKPASGNGNGLKKSTGNNLISFNVDGHEVVTSGWNISRFDMGKGIQINITSNMHEDKRSIAFNINGDRPGRYSLKEGSRDNGTGYGSYKPDYADLLNSFSFEEGELIITALDTTA